MNRRPALDSDLTIGTTVYRSATSSKAWTVLYIGAPDQHRSCYVYALSPGGAGFAARNLYVDTDVDASASKRGRGKGNLVIRATEDQAEQLLKAGPNTFRKL